LSVEERPDVDPTAALAHPSLGSGPHVFAHRRHSALSGCQERPALSPDSTGRRSDFCRLALWWRPSRAERVATTILDITGSYGKRFCSKMVDRFDRLRVNRHHQAREDDRAPNLVPMLHTDDSTDPLALALPDFRTAQRSANFARSSRYPGAFTDAVSRLARPDYPQPVLPSPNLPPRAGVVRGP
jgi:hypothetical protein